MTFLRVALSIFSILNVVFWALLAWVWAVKPSWAARIPLHLGTDKRYVTTVPVWARLAAPVAAFLPPAPDLPDEREKQQEAERRANHCQDQDRHQHLGRRHRSG